MIVELNGEEVELDVALTDEQLVAWDRDVAPRMEVAASDWRGRGRKPIAPLRLCHSLDGETLVVNYGPLANAIAEWCSTRRAWCDRMD